MKRIALLLFLAICLIQWYVPAKMIWENEQIYTSGTAYKIRTIPVDPNDPFRGKYITLNYDINRYKTTDVSNLDLDNLDQVFVLISEDEEGYAKIDDLQSIQPATGNYLTARNRSFKNKEGVYTFRLDYPFQKFFMEETKAPKAETLYRDALRQSDKQVYGLVKIKEGKAVLVDVQVDGTSIVELVTSDE